jgi:hypothetical protein
MKYGSCLGCGGDFIGEGALDRLLRHECQGPSRDRAGESEWVVQECASCGVESGYKVRRSVRPWVCVACRWRRP